MLSLGRLEANQIGSASFDEVYSSSQRYKDQFLVAAVREWTDVQSVVDEDIVRHLQRVQAYAPLGESICVILTNKRHSAALYFLPMEAAADEQQEESDGSGTGRFVLFGASGRAHQNGAADDAGLGAAEAVAAAVGVSSLSGNNGWAGGTGPAAYIPAAMGFSSLVKVVKHIRQTVLAESVEERRHSAGSGSTLSNQLQAVVLLSREPIISAAPATAITISLSQNADGLLSSTSSVGSITDGPDSPRDSPGSAPLASSAVISVSQWQQGVRARSGSADENMMLASSDDDNTMSISAATSLESLSAYDSPSGESQMASPGSYYFVGMGDKCGPLKHQGQVMTSVWRDRWFELKDGSLGWWRSKQDREAGMAARGLVPLRSVVSVEPVLENDDDGSGSGSPLRSGSSGFWDTGVTGASSGGIQSHTFRLSFEGGGWRGLAANSDKERDDWMREISYAIMAVAAAAGAQQAVSAMGSPMASPLTGPMSRAGGSAHAFGGVGSLSASSSSASLASAAAGGSPLLSSSFESLTELTAKKDLEIAALHDELNRMREKASRDEMEIEALASDNSRLAREAAEHARSERSMALTGTTAVHAAGHAAGHAGGGDGVTVGRTERIRK